MRLGMMRRPLLVDSIAAAALALLGFAELTRIIPGSNFPGSHLLHALFILATAAPLAVRRRWPLTSLIAVAVVQTIWTYGMYPLTVQPPFEPYVAALVAVYSASAYAEGRSMPAATVTVVIAFASDIPALVAGKPLGYVVPPDLVIAIAFGLGRVVAQFRHRAEAQLQRAEQLEREHDEAGRRAVAEERGRIARELHDVISHDVSMMVLQASIERRVLTGHESTTRDVLASIESTGRDALAELRRMLGVLRKADEAGPLRPQPGLDQLPELFQQARDAGLDVQLIIEGEPHQLPPGLDLAAYRIVQESLTNVAKHAHGASTTATIRFTPGSLEVDIVDDGADDLPIELPTGGHGLIGMRERIALYGGTLETAPHNGRGFGVHARIPVPETR